MILTALKYSRHPDEPRAWRVVGNNNDYAYFGNINLFVGRNATGKSRTLSIVSEIAALLSGATDISQMRFSSQCFDLVFEDRANGVPENERRIYKYTLILKDGAVREESLSINDKIYFDRKNGNITLDGLNELSRDAKAQLCATDSSKLLVTAKDDNNAAYFDTFESWGGSLKNYFFSDHTKKRQVIQDLQLLQDSKSNKDVLSSVLYTFNLGIETFGREFVEEVKNSMYDLGYTDISDIIVFNTNMGYCLGVEENGRFVVAQQEMSQGMFRALSMFIFITYTQMKNLSACILIDDIGEGVDFYRSKRLISLIIKRLHNSTIQCFMSTNDRMVMNDIPLRFWSVLDRVDPSTSVLYDFRNSNEMFEDFKYTGLNNFEFLTTDFYKNGFGSDDEEKEHV